MYTRNEISTQRDQSWVYPKQVNYIE
jgi:hypothetical protein